MKQVHVYFSVGRVTMLSTKLLSNEKFDRLVDNESISDALKVLYEVQYGNGVTVQNPNDFEVLLQNELLNTTTELKELCLKSVVSKFFLIGFDYLNAKILFKSRLSGQNDIENCFVGGTIAPQKLFEAINSQNYEGIDMQMAKAFAELEKAVQNGTVSPSLVDISLDQAMFLQKDDIAKQSKFPLLKKLLRFEIDCLNVLMLLRSKKTNQTEQKFLQLFLPNGTLTKQFMLEFFDKPTSEFVNKLPRNSVVKPFAELAQKSYEEGSPITAEAALNKGKAEIVSSKMNTNSLQPVVDHYTKKIAEIDKVRFILICIKNGVTKNSIKERLEQFYA